MWETQAVAVRHEASGELMGGRLLGQVGGPRDGEGVANPTAFCHPGKEMRCVVHGDDFTFLGWESDLEEMAERLRLRRWKRSRF